jgi:hypothetical protein
MDEVDICVNCSNKTDTCSSDEEYVIYLYVYTPLAILGVFLNVLNIVVFVRMKCKNSTLMFLVVLAVADMLYLVFACPIGPVRCLLKKNPSTHVVGSFYEIYIYLPLVNVFTTLSNWATVVLALDRTVHIERSKAALRTPTMSRRTQWIITGCISVGSIVVNIPYFFYRTLNSDGDVEDSPLAKTTLFEAYMWIRMIVIKIIPIAVVAICNIMLIRVLIGMNARRKTLVPQSTQAKLQHQQVQCAILY